MRQMETLHDLELFLSQKFKTIWTEYEVFESGAEMLRIHFNGRYFVFALVNPNSVWMDEPLEDDGLNSSYRHHFISVSSAMEMLLHELSVLK